MNEVTVTQRYFHFPERISGICRKDDLTRLDSARSFDPVAGRWDPNRVPFDGRCPPIPHRNGEFRHADTDRGISDLLTVLPEGQLKRREVYADAYIWITANEDCLLDVSAGTFIGPRRFSRDINGV